jgi:hypothetical protein
MSFYSESIVFTYKDHGFPLLCFNINLIVKIVIERTNINIFVKLDSAKKRDIHAYDAHG